jgi:hypothetical protein
VWLQQYRRLASGGALLAALQPLRDFCGLVDVSWRSLQKCRGEIAEAVGLRFEFLAADDSFRAALR